MTNQNFDKLSCYDDLIVCLRSLEDLFLLMGSVDGREQRLVHACSEIGMVLTARFRERLELKVLPDHPGQATSSEE